MTFPRVSRQLFQPKTVIPSALLGFCRDDYVYRSGSKAFLEGTFFLKGRSSNEHYLIVSNRDIADSELKVAQTNVSENHMIAPLFYNVDSSYGHEYAANQDDRRYRR